MTKQDILEFMHDRIESKRPFWGIAASDAGDATKARDAGASWITVTHAAALDARVPASVIGLLPYANANDGVLERAALAREVENFPALAGVFASDQFHSAQPLLRRLRDGGFHGVQNYPSVGLAEGRFKAFFQDTGMDYDREIAMAEIARKMDFFVSALVFTPEHAEAMIMAGADMVVFHPGLTADGEFRGSTPLSGQRFSEVAEAAQKRSKRVIVARLAFERDASGDTPGFNGCGIQYDFRDWNAR